uniref:Uncharacterized protein n=1 Tax=Vibrio parahaemolyticus TaxID=670 RepID=A0A1Y1BCM6_VIBPH|nr:hypothetical protein [Vibrio parahaemolyticus]
MLAPLPSSASAPSGDTNKRRVAPQRFLSPRAKRPIAHSSVG